MPFSASAAARAAGCRVWLVPYGYNVQNFGAGKEAPWRAGANDATTVNAFWGRRQDCNFGYQPTLFTGGAWLPPRFALHRYYGQEWDKGVCVESNFGATGRVDLGGDWKLGIERSLRLE